VSHHPLEGGIVLVPAKDFTAAHATIENVKDHTSRGFAGRTRHEREYDAGLRVSSIKSAPVTRPVLRRDSRRHREAFAAIQFSGWPDDALEWK
jgi:hypothetical protein